MTLNTTTSDREYRRSYRDYRNNSNWWSPSIRYERCNRCYRIKGRKRSPYSITFVTWDFFSLYPSRQLLFRKVSPVTRTLSRGFIDYLIVIIYILIGTIGCE